MLVAEQAQGQRAVLDAVGPALAEGVEILVDAVFAVDDPLPGLLELPLLVYQEWKQRRRFGRVQANSHSLESSSFGELERISRRVPIPAGEAVPKVQPKT